MFPAISCYLCGQGKFMSIFNENSFGWGFFLVALMGAGCEVASPSRLWLWQQRDSGEFLPVGIWVEQARGKRATSPC